QAIRSAIVEVHYELPDESGHGSPVDQAISLEHAHHCIIPLGQIRRCSNRPLAQVPLIGPEQRVH
ncbi:MAG: hypothetical protein OSA92_08485, partial [Pirellulaceae bacterium]|nr:hypothetical protein [Pirellulaceae bacterium]